MKNINKKAVYSQQQYGKPHYFVIHLYIETHNHFNMKLMSGILKNARPYKPHNLRFEQL